MHKHIKAERKRLLARQDEIAADLRTVHGGDYYAINALHHEQEEIAEALAKLDELNLAIEPQYPRVKVRRVPDPAEDHLQVHPDRRWVVSERLAPEVEAERVLGFLPDLPTAHRAATEYIAVQRFLADRLAHPHGAGL